MGRLFGALVSANEIYQMDRRENRKAQAGKGRRIAQSIEAKKEGRCKAVGVSGADVTRGGESKHVSIG